MEGKVVRCCGEVYIHNYVQQTKDTIGTLGGESSNEVGHLAQSTHILDTITIMQIQGMHIA